MQTFLPEADFAKTAKHLDRKRLIKQSVENLQVLKSLAGYYNESGAWVNHPAVKLLVSEPLPNKCLIPLVLWPKSLGLN